ncbi:hypothetical protein F7725_006065 [Dissostichus mawsoni]|uniref:Uncharacterized protein n=1 Tax=Dissostichus mawsoni TaxID=36200 RepID=A0A7J5YTD3_DISMA|nr:hypothetical protein F7725_006065 [Dissostichus mawsoni]
MTLMTASTLMGASRLEYCDTTLEHREVVALFRSVSRSLSSTGRLIPVRTSTPFSTAFWKDSEMVQLGAGLQQSSSNHNHRGGAVSSLDVLGFG